MDNTKFVKVDNSHKDTVNIKVNKTAFKLVASLVALITICAVGFTIFGVIKAGQIVHLKRKVQLQDDQLKLLDSKTKNLEKKMKEVNALDHELRQMLNGADRGLLPQGGNGEMPKSKRKQITGHKPSALMARIYKLDAQARRHIISFYTMQSMLEAGAGERIANVQNYLRPMDGKKDSHIPGVWPTKGMVTSYFGTRRDPIMGGRRYHEGMDIANRYGTPIVATADGVVTKTDYDGAYGLVVEIDNGEGFTTRFAHNSSSLVSVGEHVKRGQVIAQMGSTGRSTGVHCHYEVLINGSHVDPMLFMGNH